MSRLIGWVIHTISQLSILHEVIGRYTSHRAGQTQNSFCNSLWFNVMPFGLQGAPATFQRLMDKVLRGQEKFAVAYLDDVVQKLGANICTMLNKFSSGFKRLV